MKKISALLLVLTVVLGMAACGGKSASDVDVGGFCVGSVLGVVCFVEAGELQRVASVSACGKCVFHFSPDCNAKLGIMV